MTDQPGASHKPATGRSRVTNGKTRGTAILPSVPSRSPWMRLFRDEYSDLISHMGGEDNAYATEPRKGLARRAAALSTELIHLEDQIGGLRASGQDPDAVLLDTYCRMTGVYRRLLSQIGLDRVARPIETLAGYLEARRIEKAEDAEADA